MEARHSTAAGHDVTPAPSHQGARWWAGTIGAGALVLAGCLIELRAEYPGSAAEGAWVVATLWAVAGVGLAVLMCWRDTRPFEVCLTGAALGAVGPIGPLAALVALSWVVTRCSIRRAAWAAAATALALAATFRRDSSRPSDDAIFDVSGVGGVSLDLTPAGSVVVGALFLLLAVTVGFLRRVVTIASVDAADARQAAGDHSQRAEALSVEAQSLRSELTRQEERDLIAREMHDAVAHHLSLVSLQAASLEVDPSDVRDGARAIRLSAHRALDEMRALIASLRDGATERYDGTTPALADVSTLLRHAQAQGIPLTADVFVTDAHSAPPALGRAVYRILQECLTNSTRHAPGSTVEVDVRAAPGAGVSLVVRNETTGTDPVSVTPGSGTGLIGMQERCAALGGRLESTDDQGWFTVRATLPWVDTAAQGDGRPPRGWEH